MVLMTFSHQQQTQSGKRFPQLQRDIYSSYLKNRNPQSIFLSPVSHDEVIKIIDSFSEEKPSGPNSLPVRILKLIKNDVSNPISFLINLSFESGMFPQTLKLSKVVPVLKKGSPLEVSNHRPISLLSNIEKIYEKVMYNMYNLQTSSIAIYVRRKDVMYPLP